MPPRRIAVIAFAVLGVIALAFALLVTVTPAGRRAVVALALGDAGTASWPDHPQVRYEPGAEAGAGAVAGYLEPAITTVERAQLRPFRGPVTVIVCASPESFARRTAQRRTHRGRSIATARRIFLSPRAFAFELPGVELPIDSHRSILIHELSHVHLQQHLGALAYGRLPRWFQEGLAVWLSGGGGAEGISEQAALRAIASGLVLRPDQAASSWRRRDADDHPMRPPMFDRQSAILVAALAADPTAFRTFLHALLDRRPFAAAMRLAYGTDIATFWHRHLVARGLGTTTRLDTAPSPR